MRYYTAYTYLVELLSRREYSEYELRRKLKLKQFDPEEAEEALVKLQQLNFQNDRRFTESFIHDYLLRRVGEKTIRLKLRQRGVDPDLVDEVFAEFNQELDWKDQAWDYFVQRRLFDKDLEDYKQRQKALAKMLRAGYSYEQANSAISKYRSGDYDPDELL